MIEKIELDRKIKVKDDIDDILLVVPKAIRVTEIDEDAVGEFSSAISAAMTAGMPIIPIVIDSTGGDVYSLWAMVDILNSVPVPIATIVEGKAMSCGAALFTCGTEGYRYIGPNATLMIHEVMTIGTNGGTKTEDAKADAAETERLNKALFRMMEQNIGTKRGSPLYKRYKDIQNRSDWYITPEEAVKLRLANHIGIPTLTTKVNVEIALEFEEEDQETSKE